MFSRILTVNATSKLYRTSSYLFPCTATQEAEREQEECQRKELISEGILQGKESGDTIYFIRVQRLCARCTVLR